MAKVQFACTVYVALFDGKPKVLNNYLLIFTKESTDDIPEQSKFLHNIKLYFASSLINASSALPGSSATAAEDSKRRKCASLAFGYHFVPFFVEISGVIGLSAIALIKEAGCRIADWEDDSRATSFLFQIISLVIVRENSIGILGSGKSGEFS